MRKYTKITTSTLKEIRRLNGEGKNDAVIAKMIGIAYQTVTRYRRGMGLPPRKKSTKAVTYTVYDAKTDELLAIGTVDKCAAMLGFQNASGFYEMVSRVAHGRAKKYTVFKEKNLEG